MHNRKYLVAGNWKMNGTLESLSEIVKVDKASVRNNSDLVLCLPSTIIHAASEKKKANDRGIKKFLAPQSVEHEALEFVMH